MARNFKTPLKASNEPTDEEVADMVSLVETTYVYKRKITRRAEKLNNSDTSFLMGVIHAMEEKLEEISRMSVIQEAVSEQVNKRIRLELPILSSKTGIIEAAIGKRVKNEVPGSEAPTVWRSIASLSTFMHDVQTHGSNEE
jgi:hypothetical protein